MWRLHSQSYELFGHRVMFLQCSAACVLGTASVQCGSWFLAQFDECPVATGCSYKHMSLHSCILEVNNQSSRFHSLCVHQLNMCSICPETLIWGNEIILIIWHQTNKRRVAGNRWDLILWLHLTVHTWITTLTGRSIEQWAFGAASGWIFKL